MDNGEVLDVSTICGCYINMTTKCISKYLVQVNNLFIIFTKIYIIEYTYIHSIK